MIDFRDFTYKELENYIIKINEPKFRAKQIFQWIHKGVNSFDDIININKGLKEKLKNEGYICNMVIEEKYTSNIDGTTKYIMRLKDENFIECVLMKYTFGNTICISTQVGCSMGCSFCASTIGGKIRNLTAGEMFGQVLTLQNDIKEKISNVVLMGTGEPFDNYENVIKFLNIINDPNGINIGMRHITISTCGLVPQIKMLADLNLQITLAISLHAPNDEIRKKIMPIANRYSMEELLDACKYYIKRTNRRITFEYALINEINDSEENALELSKKLKGMLCHVNLIPLNKVDEREFIKPDMDKVNIFKNILLKNGIETTVRREMGSDINAACGQLRRRFIQKNK
ncbi:23S rRNA (adenine(2503)-C(2))-methyltransferase RlmN [Caloramator sp. E03]|uniref:23S rRNA (adenine(2503)-C(2))-methyltransferase RlmN n=1 Tax=Caloramator sp. E03 TaxID=2576307 RepID=UPI001110E935|nr:23S rRNA (adenine(2503)-C(2))-methyltransferase RlmN [Caloramator sp. E03]QCX32220.1 23S rRNA (adenine(2503)-C(2))-methyltransferase RlmN [Caloramator sp. E03]